MNDPVYLNFRYRQNSMPVSRRSIKKKDGTFEHLCVGKYDLFERGNGNDLNVIEAFFCPFCGKEIKE